MCLEIYIGSDKKLNLVEKNADPGFSVSSLNHFGELNLIERILDSNYYYLAGSYTGCACGFGNHQHDLKKIEFNAEKKRRDLSDFRDFLLSNMKENNLKLFCTWWNTISSVHPVRPFHPDKMTHPDFSFDEDVILELTKAKVTSRSS